MQRSLAVFFLIAFSLLAQDRAAVNGTVTDPSGGLVNGASVELKSAATGLHRVVTSSEKGLYEITPLPVGTYTIAISKAGFKPTNISGIDLRSGETRTIDARLEIGGTTE